MELMLTFLFMPQINFWSKGQPRSKVHTHTHKYIHLWNFSGELPKICAKLGGSTSIQCTGLICKSNPNYFAGSQTTRYGGPKHCAELVCKKYETYQTNSGKICHHVNAARR